MAVEINRLLDVVVREGASDLHLAVNRPPSVRIDGTMRSLNSQPANTLVKQEIKNLTSK